MPIATAELILFAIRASLRLAQAGRTAFVEGVQNMQLTLPLPATFFPAGLDVNQRAFNLMVFLKQHSEQRVQADYDRYFRDGPPGNRREKGGDDLVAAFLAYLGSGQGWSRGAGAQIQDYTARDLYALATVRQWDKSPNPSALQRVGGALIEVAVDYFANVPGALDENSRYSKSVRTFLHGMEDANFQEGRWDGILLSIFSAGLQALSQHPEIYSGEGQRDPLLRTVVKGVLDDIATRLKDIRNQQGDEFTAVETFERVGASVLTSLITGSARSVLDNPEVLGITDKGQQNLVQGVGRALLEIMSSDLKPENSGKQELKALADGFRRIASTGGLEKVVHAALKVAAENPGLIGTGNATADAWLQHVLTDLYGRYPDSLKLFRGENFAVDPELFTDVAYLLLANGIKDLQPLLLDAVGDKNSALLTQVATSVLGTVADASQPGQPVKWRLRLTESDVRGLVGSVLRAVAEHPEWLPEDPKVRALVPAAVGLVCDWLTQDAGAGYSQRLKALVRSQSTTNLVAALFTSGLIPLSQAELDNLKTKATRLKETVKLVLDMVTEGGLSGLGTLESYATLHDLFLALKDIGFLDKILEDDDALRDKVLSRLGSVLEGLRRGKLVTLADIERELKKAA
jgi:hypothetical protein